MMPVIPTTPTSSSRRSNPQLNGIETLLDDQGFVQVWRGQKQGKGDKSWKGYRRVTEDRIDYVFPEGIQTRYGGVEGSLVGSLQRNDDSRQQFENVIDGVAKRYTTHKGLLIGYGTGAVLGLINVIYSFPPEPGGSFGWDLLILLGLTAGGAVTGHYIHKKKLQKESASYLSALQEHQPHFQYSDEPFDRSLMKHIPPLE